MQLFDDEIRGKRVAVVGNSASILKERLGMNIDSYEVVIRINLGIPCTRLPDRPYIDPAAVGRRTTIWAAARYWPGVLPDFCKLILWMKLTKLGKQELNTLWDSKPHCPVELWPEDLERECKEFVGADPSTGIRLLWYMRNRLQPAEVATFGFDCWRSLTHWAGRRNTHNHDRDKEWNALRRLGFQ